MSSLKKDAGKVRMELLPPLALKRIAQVFTFGAKKYDSWAWSKGIEYSRIYAAMHRHLNAWYSGETHDCDPNCIGCFDPEKPCEIHTGQSHLHNAGACIMMLIEMEELRPDLDDRPTHYTQPQPPVFDEFGWYTPEDHEFVMGFMYQLRHNIQEEWQDRVVTHAYDIPWILQRRDSIGLRAKRKKDGEIQNPEEAKEEI